MTGEFSVLALFLQVVAPIGVATVLARAFREGGPARLWRDAAILVVPVGIIALWAGQITIYHHGPRNAAGLDAWPWFPGAVLVSALAVQILGFRVVPNLVRIVAATLAGMITVMAGAWIA